MNASPICWPVDYSQHAGTTANSEQKKTGFRSAVDSRLLGRSR
jgi:hypothetical protein